MAVAVRHRDRNARNPGLGFLDGTGIRTAAAGLPELIGDLHGIARFGQPAHQARIGYGRVIGHVNCRAETELGVVAGVFLAIPGGQVIGWGGIQGDPDIGVEGIRSYFGAARADLFLNRESCQQVDLRWRMLDQFDQDGNSQAVVERLGHQRRPAALELGGEGGPLAGFDLAGAGTGVDAHGLQRDFVLALFCSGEMDRARPDHGRDVLCADQHSLAGQLAHIDAADDFKAEQALAIVGHQHKADFVHVGRQHHAQTRLAKTFFYRQYVAERVHPDILCVAFELFQHDVAYFALIARNPAGIAQPFQELDLLGSYRWHESSFFGNRYS